MKEYFVLTMSKVAPFISDKGTSFIQADSPEHAVELIREKYSHPAGLFSLGIYNNATDYHKGKDPLVIWVDQERYKEMYKEEFGGK
jgi:hypothetical protein